MTDDIQKDAANLKTFSGTLKIHQDKGNNIKAWRAQRILALIPPSDSEPSDVENDENNEDGVLSLDDSSSCRTLSPGLEEFLNGFDDDFEEELASLSL
ncbi:unnamed protein product [Parnassius mnemosyne]|uniref:Uncharacterized protein n=1 Tax=Parnassius mnemosyne TaxID=213953 RepID=A0AAV1KY40_9NEOP